MQKLVYERPYGALQWVIEKWFWMKLKCGRRGCGLFENLMSDQKSFLKPDPGLGLWSNLNSDLWLARSKMIITNWPEREFNIFVSMHFLTLPCNVITLLLLFESQWGPTCDVHQPPSLLLCCPVLASTQPRGMSEAVSNGLLAGGVHWDFCEFFSLEILKVKILDSKLLLEADPPHITLLVILVILVIYIIL